MLYAVGDSHAFNVARHNSDDWINLAIPGKTSTDNEVINSIDNLLEGSTVLISLGANDTAATLKKLRNKENINPPDIIIKNIINIINLIKEKDCNTVFLLFPKNDIRSDIRLHPYSDEYQYKVRSGLKEALIGNSVVDYEYGLVDGVHYSRTSYQQIEKDIRENYS